MIITLTPNTGVDHTIQVSSFQLNRTFRATAAAWGMGGKATDVSWILGRIGVPTRALGFAAGPNGQRMDDMLRERGAETSFVWVDGETRLNTILIVESQGQSTITTSTLNVSPGHLSEFELRYQQALKDASCVVMGGSLPRGVPAEFYIDVIEQAHAEHVPVIFDSSGPALIAGIQGRPDVIKPNLIELGDLLGYLPKSREEVQVAARKLHQDFGTNVIVTLGEEGAIAVSEESSFFVEPASVLVVSSAGAGDGVLAGMAMAYEQGESFEYGLQHGFALAAAVLKTLPTADFNVDDYREMLSRVCLTRF